MRRLLPIVFAAFILTACAPLATSPVAQPAVADAVPTSLIEYQRSRSQAWTMLQVITDHIGHRLSGSPGLERAIEWTSESLRSWGLETWNDPVAVPHWVRGREEGELISHMNQPIVLTALGGSIATPLEGLTAEVVVVGSYEELEALGDRVQGKIVLYDNPFDMELVRQQRVFEAYGKAVVFRSTGAIRAAQQGAVASLVRSVTTASLRTPHTGAMRYDPNVPRIPAAAVTVEDAELIRRLHAQGERVMMRLVLTPQTLPDAPSANVIAELKGRELPEEIVVIGAHLDSWDLGTGAIDNGSGVVMVMETLRMMKELGLQPRRTIRAVLFTNEENGLRGARDYAARYKDILHRHVATIEIDSGVAEPWGFSTTLSAQEIERFSPFVRHLAVVGATRMATAASTGADTSLLVATGIPGFGLTPDPTRYFDYHHSPADTLDKVDPRQLAENAAAAAALAWTLAEMPERLRPAE
jgi:carboxypeptidase Q